MELSSLFFWHQTVCCHGNYSFTSQIQPFFQKCRTTKPSACGNGTWPSCYSAPHRAHLSHTGLWVLWPHVKVDLKKEEQLPLYWQNHLHQSHLLSAIRRIHDVSFAWKNPAPTQGLSSMFVSGERPSWDVRSHLDIRKASGCLKKKYSFGNIKYDC